jgi:hypothetical protein
MRGLLWGLSCGPTSPWLKKGRHGRSPGLQHVNSAATGMKSPLTSPLSSKAMPSAAATEPVDSGALLSLTLLISPVSSMASPASPKWKETLLRFPALSRAGCCDRRSGSQQVSYEFYSAILPYLILLLTALNVMLANGLLTPSLRHGISCLLP